MGLEGPTAPHRAAPTATREPLFPQLMLLLLPASQGKWLLPSAVPRGRAFATFVL